MAANTDQSPGYRVIYQRLKDDAPEVDIDPQTNSIDIVAIEPTLIHAEGDVLYLLSQLQLELPPSVYGFVTSTHPGVLISNNLVPPGFAGALTHIGFCSNASDRIRLFKAGDVICSVCLLHTRSAAIAVQERTLINQVMESLKNASPRFAKHFAESPPTTPEPPRGDGPGSLCLHSGSGAVLHSSRIEALRTAIRTTIREKEQAVLDAAIQAHKDAIRARITFDSADITNAVINRCIDYIYDQKHYNAVDDYRAFSIYDYRLEQFSDAQAAADKAASYKDCGHYWWYKTWLTEWQGLHYALIIQSTTRNPLTD